MTNYEVTAAYQDFGPLQNEKNEDMERWVVPRYMLPDILEQLATYDLPIGWRRRYLKIEVKMTSAHYGDEVDYRAGA